MSGGSGQGWITEEALFTVSPAARQVRQRKEVKMNHLSPAEKREFLKSMEVEWQTLLKNQAARVLSLEETAQARGRWPDRAMDTRWARTWKPDESKPSGLRVKARLIIKGFTDHDLLADIQETNRVVRLAKAQTDLALPVCRILVDQDCFVSFRDASGGGTRVVVVATPVVVSAAVETFTSKPPQCGLSLRFRLSGWRE